MGYITKTGRGYITTMKTFEPIHARNLVVEIAKYMKNHKSAKVKTEKKEPKAVAKKKKEFSLLWGLIRIKY